jgi:hypothetical protein
VAAKSNDTIFPRRTAFQTTKLISLAAFSEASLISLSITQYPLRLELIKPDLNPFTAKSFKNPNTHMRHAEDTPCAILSGV